MQKDKRLFELENSIGMFATLRRKLTKKGAPPTPPPSLFHQSDCLCFYDVSMIELGKKVREKSRECHNHKPQPFPDPKRKRKLTNLNKHKSNKRTKSTKISPLFPKRDNRNAKRTEKHKNKMAHGKTYNKSPRRINHKATKRVRLTPGPPP